MARDIGAFFVGLIIIAVVFVLVRPGSNGPAFVTAIGQAISNMLNAATGGSGTQTAATSSGTGASSSGASSGGAAGSSGISTVGSGAATAGTTVGSA